tara:strand:- start:31 stop:384 length:354 start_codon:yes stop_codon:yes gene_type:complete
MSKDCKNDLYFEKIYFSYNDHQNKKEIYKNLNLTIKKELVTVIMVTHSIEEAALLSDEVLVTGRAPINVIKRYIPPKCIKADSWPKLGLRKSLKNKKFLNYVKSIRDASYKVIEKEN